MEPEQAAVIDAIIAGRRAWATRDDLSSHSDADLGELVATKWLHRWDHPQGPRWTLTAFAAEVFHVTLDEHIEPASPDDDCLFHEVAHWAYDPGDLKHLGPIVLPAHGPIRFSALERDPDPAAPEPIEDDPLCLDPETGRPLTEGGRPLTVGQVLHDATTGVPLVLFRHRIPITVDRYQRQKQRRTGRHKTESVA